MRVKDLIELLKLYDGETLVVTSGMDETGYADVRYCGPVRIVPVNTHFMDYEDPVIIYLTEFPCSPIILLVP